MPEAILSRRILGQRFDVFAQLPNELVGRIPIEFEVGVRVRDIGGSGNGQHKLLGGPLVTHGVLLKVVRVFWDGYHRSADLPCYVSTGETELGEGVRSVPCPQRRVSTVSFARRTYGALGLPLISFNARTDGG